MNFADLHNNITVKPMINPAATPADNTPIVSAIIDCKDYEGVEVIISAGAIPDADVTYTTLLEASDDPGMAGAVPVNAAPFLVGAIPAIQFNSDNSVFNFGKTVGARYVRLTLTPLNNSSASLFSAIAVLYRGRFTGKQPGPGSFPTTEGTPLSN